MAGAVARTADTLYDRFDDDQRDTARQALVRLVAFGEGVEDTRRRVPRAELELPGIDPVLARLAAARLIVLGEDTVEIAHEALIRAWPRLRHWLSADRDGLRTHRQLGEAARSWVSLDRDPGALYRGARLVVAREWATRNAGPATMIALEREFLAASIDLADRERDATTRRHRQLRYLVLTLSVLLVTAVGTGVVALVQRRDAVAQRQTAVSRQLAAESLGLAGTEPGTAMLLATQAYRTAPTTEARGALLSMSPHRGHLGKLLGHSGAVSQLAYSRDGDTSLSVGRDQTLSLWDSGRRARTAALTGGEDTRLVIWDLDRRVRTATLTGLTKRVRDIVFSPDGNALATTAGNEVVLWDMAHHTRSATLSGHTRAVQALAFSPDGHTLATASADSTVILWDVTRSVPVATLTGHTGGAYAVAFSPDGATLAAGAGDTTARPTRSTASNWAASRWPMRRSPSWSRPGRSFSPGSAPTTGSPTWASGVGGLRRPNFAQMEKLVEVAHLRGHYHWASHEIHADARGDQLNVVERGDVLHRQTGPMLSNLAEPATWALASLELCMQTLPYSTDDVSPLEMLGSKTLQYLIDDAREMFEQTEGYVEQMENRIHLWPRWRRELWPRWRLLT